MKDPTKNTTHNILSLYVMRALQFLLLLSIVINGFRIYVISISNFSEAALADKGLNFVIYIALELFANDTVKLIIDLLLF